LWRQADMPRIRLQKSLRLLLSTGFRFKVDIVHKSILIHIFKREHHEAIALAIGLLVINIKLDCFRSRHGSRRVRRIVHIDGLDLQSLDFERFGSLCNAF